MSCLGGLVGVILACLSSLVEIGFLFFSLVRVLESYWFLPALREG
jgi:hypothetical protein